MRSKWFVNFRKEGDMSLLGMNLLSVIIVTLCATCVLYWLIAFKLFKKGAMAFVAGLVAGLLIWSSHWVMGYPVGIVDLLLIVVCCGIIASGFVWGPRVRAKLPF